jgi:lipopolysaccharide export LptBFGC system permease protein LptF
MKYTLSRFLCFIGLCLFVCTIIFYIIGGFNKHGQAFQMAVICLLIAIFGCVLDKAFED